jgi:hypothetical protein
MLCVGFVEYGGLLGAKYPGQPRDECLLLSKAVVTVVVGVSAGNTTKR